MEIIRLLVLGFFLLLTMGCTQPDNVSVPGMPTIAPLGTKQVATPTQIIQNSPSATLIAIGAPTPTTSAIPTPKCTSDITKNCSDGYIAVIEKCVQGEYHHIDNVSCADNYSVANPPETLILEDYDGKFFAIKKPAGWEIATGGSCSTFSFVIKDKAKPQRQIFYFGEIGPVYLDESQKVLDEQYMEMGGRILWYEMPIVKPLTPENFLKNEYLLAQTSLLRKFMTDLPELNEVEIISSEAAKSPVKGETKLMRALFKSQGGLGEGQFFLTTSTLIPLTGYPSGGIGYGMTFFGIAAEKKEFKNLEKTLGKSINSFAVSQEYIDACIRGQNAAAASASKTIKTLSETSDTIMSGWENRNKVDDIISEKRSDAMLGRERVYDPDTGTVYDVNNGFYDDYNSERQKFDMSRLEKLPESDWALWNAATEDASKIH
jgi:hypothetical protein